MKRPLGRPLGALGATMPRYAYRAKDSGLKLVEGSVEADSEAAAVARLGRLGVFPLTLTEADDTSCTDGGTRWQSVPGLALAHMSRQLADLVGGGVSLCKALALVAEQIEDRALRRVMADVGAAVRDGQLFSDALARHPGIFAPLYLSMITTGETGGGLDAVLLRLADLLEGEAEFRSRVLAALVYPLVVLAVGIVTVLVLLTYVVPKLSVLFVELGQLPPWPTRLLLAMSGACARWWWVGVVGLALGAWAFRRFRRSAVGAETMDRFLLRMSVVGPWIRKQQTARFARNLGVIVGQGVPVLQAMAVANATVTNVVLRRVMDRAQEAVRGGQSLAGALAAGGQFPAFVSHLVAIGEESGTLERALLNVARSYEREADRALRVFTTVLEPLLIVVVGAIVMFIVMAMLLPIFQIGLGTP